MIPRPEHRVFKRANNGIGTKDEFLALEAAGTFGNHFRSWPDLLSLRVSGYKGWLRICDRNPDGRFKVNEVLYKHLMPVLWGLRDRGAAAGQLFFGEVPAPDNVRRINFEVHRDENYLCLTYGTGQMPLRQDLCGRNIQPVYGLNAVRILKWYLQDEWKYLDQVWDRFPSANIEGSCWNEPVGVLNRRMVIWEARQF